MISGGHNRDYNAVASTHFLNVRDAFLIARDRIRIALVVRGQHYDGKIFVDQRVGAVLHFAGGIAFGVDVGNFLKFEGAFERDWVVNAGSEVQKTSVAKKLPRQGLL